MIVVACLIAACLVVAAFVAWSLRVIASEIRSTCEEARRGRTLAILALFGPGLAAAQGDPRALLVWQPLAQTARALFPGEFAELDRANGGKFPFGDERLQAAHARWTADWLAWERAHDAEYKRKAAAAELELIAADENTKPAARAGLDAVEREKLELYQRRYEEYVRVAKALQILHDSPR